MMICEVDNDRRHIYAYFNRTIVLQDCLDLFNHVAEKIISGTEYRQIIVFDRASRLSEMDITAIKAAQQHMSEAYSARGLLRPKCAFVSLDELAEPVLNYWRALCENDLTIAANYQVFTDIDTACDWCGITRPEVTAFIERTRLTTAS